MTLLIGNSFARVNDLASGFWTLTPLRTRYWSMVRIYEGLNQATPLERETNKSQWWNMIWAWLLASGSGSWLQKSNRSSGTVLGWILGRARPTLPVWPVPIENGPIFSRPSHSGAIFKKATSRSSRNNLKWNCTASSGVREKIICVRVPTPRGGMDSP